MKNLQMQDKASSRPKLMVREMSEIVFHTDFIKI